VDVFCKCRRQHQRICHHQLDNYEVIGTQINHNVLTTTYLTQNNLEWNLEQPQQAQQNFTALKSDRKLSRPWSRDVMAALNICFRTYFNIVEKHRETQSTDVALTSLPNIFQRHT
jgi:hypothetical protein